MISGIVGRSGDSRLWNDGGFFDVAAEAHQAITVSEYRFVVEMSYVRARSGTLCCALLECR